MSDDDSEFYTMATSAIAIHEVFQSLVDAGFTENQSMQILIANIHAAGGVQ